jgi:hypothetical protein
MGREALLAGGVEIDGMNPDVQLDLAALEHGANGHREGLAARTALVDAGTGRLAGELGSFVDDAAMRADWAIGPVERLKVLASRVFVAVNLE